MRFLALFSLLTLIACGSEFTYPRANCTVSGNTIVCPDGSELILPVIPDDTRIFDLPIQGACVKVLDNVWVENEGSKADVYNNAECDHNPPPYKSLCDNIDKDDDWNECEYENNFYMITGEYGSMKLFLLMFE